jgi:hypothetical protein
MLAALQRRRFNELVEEALQDLMKKYTDPDILVKRFSNDLKKVLQRKRK